MYDARVCGEEWNSREVFLLFSRAHNQSLSAGFCGTHIESLRTDGKPQKRLCLDYSFPKNDNRDPQKCHVLWLSFHCPAAAICNC